MTKKMERENQALRSFKQNNSTIYRAILSLLTFSKAQVSAFIGGTIDYITMIIFTEIVHVHFTISIAIGGIVGAGINFFVNRIWSFKSEETTYQYRALQQLIMFLPVVIGSIVLKSSGTYLLTLLTKLDYKLTRLAADALVSVFFNYMLQKHWVFKKRY